MTEWQYRKIDLNLHDPRWGELSVLNAAGADGWELVGISSNQIAYMKRPLSQATAILANASEAVADPGISAPLSEPHAVRPKYRDPTTNETWSGRGRMANWLKRKKDTGEDIDKYLV